MNINELGLLPLPIEIHPIIFDYIPKENLGNFAEVSKLWNQKSHEKYNRNEAYKSFKKIKVDELKIVKEAEQKAAEKKRISDLNRPSLLKIFYISFKISLAAGGVLLTSPLILVTGIAGGLFGGFIGNLLDRRHIATGGLVGMFIAAQFGSLGSLWMFGQNTMLLKDLIERRMA